VSCHPAAYSGPQRKWDILLTVQNDDSLRSATPTIGVGVTAGRGVRTPGRLGLVLVLGLAACGDDGGNADADGAPDEADAMTNNPRNPLGEGPAPIDLGDADDLAAPGSYVILASAGITNVTGTLITGGHMGLSPMPASYIDDGFTLSTPPTTHTTCPQVAAPGKVYASDYDAPTPSNLTVAVLARDAAYTDAAGRTNPDVLNLGDGEIGGETLAPGLYRWGSTVTIPDNVTISGALNDTWVFQISGDLNVSAAKSVILAGDAQAKNIVWQVAGQATIQTDAHFEGVILTHTAVTLQTGASMTGRIYAPTLVALDDNDITAP